jgi:NADP-dependent 3-hydroxy acid dehydrogenase YdfG
MAALTGKVAWVTGAGSGIGQAAAIALAKEGATVVLTGRRKEPLEVTAASIKKAGGKAVVKPGDLMKAAAVTRIAKDIDKKFGRCDILVNNAGLNILERKWSQLTPAGAELVIDGNLSSAFYCSSAVLPMMRKRKDGVLIHTSSMAGRTPSPLSGAAYSAAKHGVVAMSHTINMEECVNGIRSCVVCPGEVATPILDNRPIPVSKEERARMAQSEDVGDLIRYVACLPAHVTINEVWITPAWNRGYIANLARTTKS